MSNLCETCRQQMLEALPPRSVEDVSTRIALPAEAQAHLASCPDCAREWTCLQNMMASLHALPLASAPVDLRAKIRSQIVDEQSAKKSFWQSLTLRPQRLAWGGSVVLGGLLLVLASQQPIEFFPQTEDSSGTASAPTTQESSSDAAQNSAVRIEQKPLAAKKQTAQKPAKPGAAAAPARPTSSPISPPTQASPIPTEEAREINRQGSLRPASPMMAPPSAPSAAVTRDVTPPVNSPPGAGRLAPSVPPTFEAPIIKKPTAKSPMAQSPAAKNSAAQPAPKAAPKKIGTPTIPNVFADSAPQKPAVKPAPSMAAQPRNETFVAGNSTMMKSAERRADNEAASRPAPDEGQSNLAMRARPQAPTTSPENSGPQAYAPPAAIKAPGGSAAQESSAQNRSFSTHAAPPNAESMADAGVAAAPIEREDKENSVNFSARFIPERSLKNARLRLLLPDGASFVSPSSTQELVVWSGATKAKSAIPVSARLQFSAPSISVRLVLEQKRGDNWRTVQEQNFRIASP